MKNIMEKFAALFIVAALFVSCSDETTDLLDEGNYVGVNSELYSGLWGCASTVADVADQALILEALRGNLLEPTENAGTEVWNIWKYSDLNGNTLADPAGYYRVIMNVNDYVAHVDKYRKENPTALNFEEKYGVTFDLYISTAIRYKVWAYMMLAKIYGEAIYFDDPLSEYQDIAKYPKLGFDQIIDKCLELMNTGMYGVDGKQITRWRTFLFPSITGENEGHMRYDRYQFTPQCLLAELYLYKRDYHNAAINAMTEITLGGRTGGGECYIMPLRGAYSSGWKNCIHTYFRWEDITMASYNPRMYETNRLEDFASNVSPYSYYVRPTQVAMARFDTTSVPCIENAILSDRYRGRGGTFAETETGQIILRKWVSGVAQTTETVIPLYRASGLHLILCEALAGLAKDPSTTEEMRNAFIETALVLLNQGIGTYWDTTTGDFKAGSCFDKVIKYFDPSNANKYLANLYRGTNHTQSASQYIHKGIRGRVAMGNVGGDILSTDEDSGLPLYTPEEQCWKLDSLLADEYFFELSGEGQVMFALYRMMQNYPEKKEYFIKSMAAGRGDVESILSADKGWFIDYDLTEGN